MRPPSPTPDTTGPVDVGTWLRTRTSGSADWPAEAVLDAKGEHRVSVVLPARNEEATVGEIAGLIRRDLQERLPLVDELLVIDSRSTDATARVAAAAGARVVHQDTVLPELGPMAGKGEALWKALAVTTGDLVVFVDADLRNFGTHFITGLLGPLLADPAVAYVKGCYERPLAEEGQVRPHGGGRVTELVARPLINLHWPALAGFIQPLAGEYAGRRDALERVPFVTGYGVELGLLIDLLHLVGLDGMAQVDLGVRVHSNQPVDALGRMACQIMLTAWSRLEREGRAVAAEPPGERLLQFVHLGDRREIRISDVGVRERPPLVTVPGYRRPSAGWRAR
ncbi:glucosyl-3-phosphoglycerate synthase [Thermomonospora cellulosilytica]|uniref:Glucosyl-3-phosphoglycerate synthase n=1 Tax=Thermomonospora cellulosilytica TaxID=1411118 RepID=A0A7W3R9P4_9ACTN|nr:glucosyl-3-phosphoglycerate synthase [Thermomonospora cellulosilytica]MBA9004981.1 glucosyl-3-phosphoglycerate synthase [Thermomonospora cellulosilytica]